MVQAPETEADFERMSWHGCRIWKIEIVAAPSDAQADLCIRAGFIALRRVCDFFRIPWWKADLSA